MEKKQSGVRRRWWVAGLFSYLVPGLGQVYNGEALKGLFFNFLFTTWGGVVFSFVFHALKRPVTGRSIAVIFILFFASFLAHLGILLEAALKAGKRPEGFQLKRTNRVLVYVSVLITSLGVDYSISSAIREYILKPYRIPTGSMKPTLVPGDFLLSNQLFYADRNPARGDVVIFKNPENERIDFIKRIVGMPGDTVEIRDGTVRIDGRALDEPYVKRESAGPSADERKNPPSFGPVIVPPDSYFVLGDNRDNSLDSRKFGALPRRLIRGKPMVVYFSSSGILKLRPGRIGRIIR
jgi:signal peptidase I